jgi:hypothetical protein
MSATTVPTVRAALKARVETLLAAAGDTQTKPSYGHPGKNIPARYIAVADTDDGVTRDQRTHPLRKTSSRTETYDLRLIIWCKTGDHSKQQQMVETSWELAGLIDDGLRDEPTLGGLVTWALPSRFIDSDLYLNEGFASEIIVIVTVNVNRA